MSMFGYQLSKYIQLTIMKVYHYMFLEFFKNVKTVYKIIIFFQIINHLLNNIQIYKIYAK